MKIHEVGQPLPGAYDSSARAVANWNNGDPEISIRIDNVTAFSEPHVAAGRGRLWLLFHEVGDLTEHGRGLNDYYSRTTFEMDRQPSERYVNDFGRLLTEHFTGTSADMSHIADQHSYSPGLGVIDFSASSPEPSRIIPFWKFDPLDGSLSPVVL